MSFLKQTLHPGVHSRVKRRMRIIANDASEGEIGVFLSAYVVYRGDNERESVKWARGY